MKSSGLARLHLDWRFLDERRDAAISESKNSINAANREYSYDGSVKKIYDRGGVFKGYAAGLYPKYANAISGSANATPQLPLAYTSATYTDADI